MNVFRVNFMKTKRKDVLLECRNLLMGTAEFLEFKVPESWDVGPIPFETDVEHWAEINGKTWVTRGQTQICIILGEKKGRINLLVKARGYNKKLDVENWLRKKRESIERKKGKKVRKAGFLTVNGHKLPYIIYSRIRKKFGFFGKISEETFLNAILNCDETSRTIFLDARLDFDDDSVIERLLDVLSTFTCH